MDHHDHVELLRPANLSPSGLWADFGAGAGAFTLALRELVGPEASIFAVDTDRASLSRLERAHLARFGSDSHLSLVPEDFSNLMDLPSLDGIVMANSLHFFQDKRRILERVRSHLKPDGVLLLVEYNVDRGNHWVPYPISFESYRTLAPQAGFHEPRLLATAPSSFLQGFYSAAASPARD